jgi:oligopeptide/dipeptide ABC transporter ATP-binding protein
MTVFDIIAEGLRVHSVGRSKEERKAMIAEILEKVGLRPEYMFRYPHEFSGGQRQRIGIARSIILNPSLVICDEPVSALDVSVQAQVINLLEDLKHDFGLTYLFIAHDLAVVKHICDRISVMYLGKIVETAETDSLFNDPLHPYTRGLLSSIPIPNPHLRSARNREIVKGDIPSPVDPPETCRFVKRCPRAFNRCWKESPSLKEVSDGHFVSCFLYD